MLTLFLPGMSPGRPQWRLYAIPQDRPPDGTLRRYSQKEGSTVQKTLEDICLKHDNGNDLCFRGRLFSECSWFDDEHQVMTRQKLYVTDKNEQVYYIVRSHGQERSRHAYRLSVDGETCVIYNGRSEMSLQFDMLMLAVRGLCGLDAGATPTLGQVEEMLRVANG